MPDVRLKLGGQIYGGWTRIRVMRSIESVADTFELTLTERWGEQAAPRPIRAGMPCEVWIGNERVVTGYVDEALPAYDGQSHTITVSGRSKAGDLVDCSLAGEAGKPLQWKGQTLLAIAKDLAGRFGIEVSATADVGAPFKIEALEPGETVWDFLEGLARRRAVRIVSKTDGNLVITRAGTARIGTALRLGENIRSASGQFTTRERFSDYIVQGQQTGDDWGSGDAAAHMQGTAIDEALKGLGRYRPLVVVADGPSTTADCKRRAEWQRNTAYGRGQGVVYTVADWRHASGLWAPNYLVPVDDAWMGIEADRLIMSVQFLLDDNGQRTELRVMPPEAADLVALPDPEKEASPWG